MAKEQTESKTNKAAEKYADSLVADIMEVRARICNVFLITAAIIAVPALAASLYRITTIGWQAVMAVHMLLAVILWSLVLFRSRVPYVFQAGFVVVMFLAIGFGGIIQFGLIAGGTVFLVASSPIATLLFGGRAGIATLLVTLAGAVVVGYFTVTGELQHGFNIADYATASSSWGTSILGWAMASTALTVSLHAFNKRLINALKISRQRQETLLRHQVDLEKTIEERNSANRELQIALDEIKTLRGIIPICSYCHRIRDDEGAWSRLEEYLSTHSEAQFSHGICPKCESKVRSEEGLDQR